MAWITQRDVLEAFRETLNEQGEKMENTMAIVKAVESTTKFAQDKIKMFQEVFNNTQNRNVAKNGVLFRNIFNELKTKSRENDEEKYLSSGGKEENEEGEPEKEPKFSPDTVSRNKTSYEVADLTIKAIQAQTEGLTSALAKQNTHLDTISKNVGHILEIVQKGMKEAKEESKEQAKAQALYNKNGYLYIAQYLDQIKTNFNTAIQPVKQMIEQIKNPKQLIKWGLDELLEKDAFKKFTEGFEDSISRGFTRTIEHLGELPLFKNNNPVSNFLRQIFIPQSGNVDIDVGLATNTGIKDVKAAQFDNVTHRTINDVIPGLLERILSQNEQTTQILSKFSGIQGTSTGTTYDMKSGTFTTRKEFEKQFQNSMKEMLQANNISRSSEMKGDLTLNEWADAIEPMIYFMATNNIPIKNFQNMDYDQAHTFLMYGLGLTSIPEEIDSHFNLFWRALHSNRAGTSMTAPQRRAIQRITQLYNDVKDDILKRREELEKEISSGLTRGDQIGRMNGWSEIEIANGSRIDFSKKAKRTKGFTPGHNLIGNADSTFREITTDTLSDIRSTVTDFAHDLKEMVTHAVHKQGSLYVHDSVSVEYLRMLTNGIRTGVWDESGVKQAESIHSQQHTGEKKAPRKVIRAKVREREKPNFDTSYANDPEQGTTTGIPVLDNLLERGRYGAMKLAQGAGYNGFDDQLKNSKYAGQKNGSGWAENSMNRADMRRVQAQLDAALGEGKISRDKYEELTAQLNNSDPDQYKTSFMKSVAQWTPAVLGGLAFGPLGIIAGLGIRQLMRKKTADRVQDQLQKETKSNKKNRKAEETWTKERNDIAEQIQEAYSQGKLTEEERDDALKQLSTGGPDEYKGGLQKWAKRLGPAVAASLLGFGPLGIIVGLVAGKKLTETTTDKLRKQLNKIKPNQEVWDDPKRNKLLQEIDQKIEELCTLDESLPNDDAHFEEKNRIAQTLSQLREYRRDIASAGKKKLAWYFTSIPGILSMLGNIRKLPGLAIKKIWTGIRVGAANAKSAISRGWTKAKSGISKAIGAILYGDSRIATPEGRAEMRAEIAERFKAVQDEHGVWKANPDENNTQEFEAAMSEFDQQCQKYDKQHSQMSAVSKVFRNIGKGIKFVAGIPTGASLKASAAKANQSVANARKLLAGNEVKTPEQQVAEAQQVIAEQNGEMLGEVQRVAQSVDELTNQAKGNSLSSYDAKTHALLEKILLAINPEAQLGDLGSIDKQHMKESPDTKTAPQLPNSGSVTTVDGKAVKNGKVQNDDSDDHIGTMAAAALANVDDAKDLKSKDEMVSLLMSSADKPETKQKIQRLAEKTYKNLNKEEQKAAEVKENTDLGFLGNKNWWKSLLGNLGLTLAGAGISAWLSDKFFRREINEEVEDREEVAQADHRNAADVAAAGSAAATMFSWNLKPGNTPKVKQSLITQHTDAAKNMFKSGKNLVSKGFSQLKITFANTSAGKSLGKAVSKVANSDAVQSVLKHLDEFKNMVKNNKFIMWLGKLTKGLFSKVKGGGIGKKLMNLFSKAAKAVAKILAVIAFLMEMMAYLIRVFNENGLDIATEWDSQPDFVSSLLRVCDFMYTNIQAGKIGGDSLGEVLTKATAVAAVNTATAFIPYYAEVKLVIVLLDIALDIISSNITDTKSEGYVITKAWKWLCDDILNLEETLIDTMVSDVIDLFGGIGDVMGGKKILDMLKEIMPKVNAHGIELLKNLGMIVVDVILVLIVSTPVLMLLRIAKVDLDIVLKMRHWILQMMEGEMTWDEFCAAFMKDAVDKTVQNWKDWAADPFGLKKLNAEKTSADTVWNAGNQLLEATSGLGKGPGGFAGDLYQENPIYKNTPYNMYDAGCGPIALTAALRQQGIEADPLSTASSMQGYRAFDGGTNPAGITAIGNRMGGKFTNGSTDVNNIQTAASQGKPVVMMGQNGAFGDGSHYMTAVGTRGNNILVRDPLSPNLRSVSKYELRDNVTNAIYGKGRIRRGIGGVPGRGLAEAFSAASSAIQGVKDLFGGLFDSGGNSSGSNGSSGSSGYSGNQNGGSNDVSYVYNGSAEYVDLTPVPPSGTHTSINGNIIYPDEIRKDPPPDKFPYDEDVRQPYSSMVNAIKDLLIAQYKYTLILPSVVACIMRGETSFGAHAHGKNLGNIMDYGGGTVSMDNYITDAQIGHRHNYEAYQYWGESIYRIGNYISTHWRYPKAIGCKDTLAALTFIQQGGYAEAAEWASKLYNYWPDSDMALLKQIDQEAIQKAKERSGTKSRDRKMAYGRGGKGLAEAIAASNAALSGIKNIFSQMFGMEVDASSTATGDDTMLTDADLSGGGFGQETSGQSATAITKGSFADRVLEYLKQEDPSARVSLGYEGVAKGLYTKSDPHTGIDFTGGRIRGVPIHSPVDGKIGKKVSNQTVEGDLNTPYKDSLGNYVMVVDKQGRHHWFGHMKPGSVTNLAVGTEIKNGDYLGQVGSTGRSTGDHVHYQLTANSSYKSHVNPSAVQGYGRFSRKNSYVPPVPEQDAVGGAPDQDYNEMLGNIYQVLVQIAENTGTSLDFMKKTTGNGRGSSSGSRPATTRAYHPPAVHSGLGASYQKFTRGF